MKSMPSPPIVLALCMLVGAGRSQAAGHAHEHGVARLDVAIEATRITLQLESPLDNLLGYERAPRTEAERKQADAMLATLRASSAMFRIDPAAQCTAGPVELTSSALKLGKPDAAEEQEGHADLDVAFGFSCVDAARAAYVDVSLFDFPRLQRLQVQVAAPRGQFRRDLKRPMTRIVLGK